MLHNWLVMDALIVFFGAAALLAAAAVFRAKSLYGRVDAAAAVALALVMVAVGLGWAPLVTGRLEMMLAVVLAGFATSIAFRKGAPESPGLFPGIYGAGVTVLAVWVLFSAAHGGGTATDHPAHQLGAILGALLGCLLMVFAAAGWMMGHRYGIQQIRTECWACAKWNTYSASGVCGDGGPPETAGASPSRCQLPPAQHSLFPHDPVLVLAEPKSGLIVMCREHGAGGDGVVKRRNAHPNRSRLPRRSATVQEPPLVLIACPAAVSSA
ncbi:hypothetical protein GCM10007170_36340 [Arthrobacter liuii]|uniref:Uncharacterized protein n=2 Tax=Arthrobacter liuii TaxID=1476996 RepID=A0ABQ2B061_9MICC|nr:hypothetical protein GCM10007170_36340 [Arthrobacter liuii]